MVLIATLLAAIPDWRADLGPFQALYVLGFAVFAIVVVRLRHYERLPRVEWIVLAVVFATRVALVPLPPMLSDDLFRYVWEGRVLLYGQNPWALAPNHPALAGLRDEILHPHINHPELAAIYPPWGVAGYALVAAIEPSVRAAKLWVLAHELALIAVLMLGLRRLQAPPGRVLVYAWCPLAIVEFAGGGHNDPTAMVWLALALLLASRRPVPSAVCLVTGVGVKLLPIVALPFLWREWSARGRWVAIAGLAAMLAGYVALTRAADSGLTAYWQRWRHNESVFVMLEFVTGSFDAARLAGLGVGTVAMVWLWQRRVAAWRSSQWVLRTLLVTGPVLHPWYLGWNLMFEPVRPSAPWLLLSCLVVLNYGVLRTPTAGSSFHPSLALRAVEYGLPLALALGIAFTRGIRRDSPR